MFGPAFVPSIVTNRDQSIELKSAWAHEEKNGFRIIILKSLWFAHYRAQEIQTVQNRDYESFEL